MDCFSLSPQSNLRFWDGSSFLIEAVTTRSKVCAAGILGWRKQGRYQARQESTSPVSAPLQGDARVWRGIFQRHSLSCYSIRELGSQNATPLFREQQTKHAENCFYRSHGKEFTEKCDARRHPFQEGRKTTASGSQQCRSPFSRTFQRADELSKWTDAGEGSPLGAKGETLPRCLPVQQMTGMKKEGHTPVRGEAACCSSALCKCFHALFASVF